MVDFNNNRAYAFFLKSPYPPDKGGYGGLGDLGYPPDKGGVFAGVFLLGGLGDLGG